MRTIRKYNGKPLLPASRAFVLMLAAGAALWGQLGRGTLTGTVSDNTGAVVPNASVAILNTATGTKGTGITTGSGNFTFPALVPGAYDLTVAAPGFREYVQKGITVAVGDTATVSIMLQLGATTDRVEVTAQASQLKSDTSEISTSVKSDYILDLPLTVDGSMRNPVFFLSLVPGYSGEVAGGGFWANKLNGGQFYGTDILVDGATIQLTRPSIPSFNYGVSVEAVQEFSVQTNNFSAEFGRTSSGIVNLVMKSGTNTLHGSVYEFMRNKVLDANGFFSNRAGIDSRSKNQNDYGFVASGPVYIPKILDGRNRLFWMSSYEAYKYPASTFSQQTMATEAFKRGDMSALLPGTPLYDPASCSGGVCTPFSGNIIPDSRISPLSRKIISFLPKGTDALVNNLTDIVQSPTESHFYTQKGDVNWSSKQKFSGSITRGSKDQPSNHSLGVLYSSQGGTSTTYVRMSHDYIFRPNLLNHINYGLSRSPDTRNSNTAGIAEYQPSALGLKGVPDLTFPGISWNGTGYIGTGSEYSRFVNQTSEINDDLSWIHGRHSLKFGFDVRRQQFNVARRENGSGLFSFEPKVTADPVTGQGGHAWASFLLGDVTGSNVRSGLILRNQWNYYSGYAQDDFKVSQKLTLNLGLRYEIQTPVVEAKDRLSGFDTSIPNPGADGRLGAYTFFGNGPGRNGRRSPQDTFYKSFGPRFGFAYRVNNDTVVRGGYGIAYSPLKSTGYAGGDQNGITGQASPSNFNWDAGFPGNLGTSYDPSSQNGNAHLAFIDRSGGRPGMVQNWTLDIQRQLKKDILFDIGYVASKGDHLASTLQHPNQTDPKYLSYGPCLAVLVQNQGSDERCAGKTPVPTPFGAFQSLWGSDATVGRALRPFPQVGHFDINDYSFTPDKSGSFTYHSLQTKLEKRFSAGLTFLVSYTWSKNLTNSEADALGASGFFGSGQFLAQDNYNRKVEKTLSMLDTPHAVVMSYTYELPIGPGKKMLASSHGVTAKVLGGWSVAGVQRYQSGIPVGAVASGVNTGLYGKDEWYGPIRPNLVPGQNLGGFSGHFDPSVNRYLNPAAFSKPANFSFGSASIALPGVRSPLRNDESFTLSKRTPIKERVTFMFRAEFFNLFNRTIFSIPSFDVSNPASFGIVSSTYYPPRHIQLAGKIEF
jgi:hypothetical protein